MQLLDRNGMCRVRCADAAAGLHWIMARAPILIAASDAIVPPDPIAVVVSESYMLSSEDASCLWKGVMDERCSTRDQVIKMLCSSEVTRKSIRACLEYWKQNLVAVVHSMLCTECLRFFIYCVAFALRSQPAQLLLQTTVTQERSACQYHSCTKTDVELLLYSCLCLPHGDQLSSGKLACSY
jgi:hypothetical protein